jgi:hypothetical protein
MTSSKTPRETILTKLWAKVSATRSTYPVNSPAGDVDRNRTPLAVSPGTHSSFHGEGLTLLHIPSGRVFVCNRTAACIWEGAAEGRSVAELSEELSRRYGIAGEVARQDTCLLVSQMELHGLILRRGA